MKLVQQQKKYIVVLKTWEQNKLERPQLDEEIC